MGASAGEGFAAVVAAGVVAAVIAEILESVRCAPAESA